MTEPDMLKEIREWIDRDANLRVPDPISGELVFPGTVIKWGSPKWLRWCVQEIDRLTTCKESWETHCKLVREQRDKWEADNARLREAVQGMLEAENMDEMGIAKTLARAALKEE